MQRRMKNTKVYCQNTFKQAYIYGALNRGPINSNQNFVKFASASKWFLIQCIRQTGY
jgi:hypothetical protein